MNGNGAAPADNRACLYSTSGGCTRQNPPSHRSYPAAAVTTSTGTPAPSRLVRVADGGPALEPLDVPKHPVVVRPVVLRVAVPLRRQAVVEPGQERDERLLQPAGLFGS